MQSLSKIASPVSRSFTDNNFKELQEGVIKGMLVSTDYTLTAKPGVIDKIINFFKSIFGLAPDFQLGHVFGQIQKDVESSLTNFFLDVNIGIKKDDVVKLKQSIQTKLDFLRSEQCTEEFINLKEGKLIINGKMQRIEGLVKNSKPCPSQEEIKQHLKKLMEKKQKEFREKGELSGHTRIFVNLKENEYYFIGQPKINKTEEGGYKINIDFFSERLKSSENPLGQGSVNFNLDSDSIAFFAYLEKNDCFSSKDEMIKHLENLKILCERQLTAKNKSISNEYQKCQVELRKRVLPLTTSLIERKSNRGSNTDDLSKLEQNIINILEFKGNNILVEKITSLREKVLHNMNIDPSDPNSNFNESWEASERLNHLADTLKGKDTGFLEPISKEFENFISEERKQQLQFDWEWPLNM